MKKLLFLVVALILSLAACAPAPTLTVTTLPPATASVSEPALAPPSVSATASPSRSVSAPPSPTPTPTVYNGTFIVADSDGAVLGGCSDGKWLTHNKAAALCKKKKTFYAYDLTDCLATVKSNGLAEDGGPAQSGQDGNASSWTCDNHKGMSSDGEYKLDIPEGYDAAFNCDFEKRNALTTAMLYTVPPYSFPTVTLLSDTSGFLPAIQEILDDKMGPGAPKAHIRTAAQCDIDGDGKMETIVNADNCMSKVEDYEYSNVYNLACVIDDGIVHIVHEFYIDKKDSGDVEYSYIQNVIDLDGDGKCEIVVLWGPFDEWITDVYKYDGNEFTKVLSYDIGS